MMVEILLFARVREIVGQDRLKIELHPGTSVGQLKALLANTQPALATILAASRVSVDNEFADESLVIVPGAEIAIIPPVSGG